MAELRAEAERRAREAEFEVVRAEGERANAELRVAEQRKRRKIQLAFFGAVFLLAAGLGAAAWWQDRQAADRKAERERAEGEQRLIEDSRDKLAAEKKLTEEARDKLAEEKTQTEKARDDLAALNERLARQEYARTVQLAYQAWRDHELARAKEFLRSCRPDLRGWEWRYVERLCNAELFAAQVPQVTDTWFTPDGATLATTGDTLRLFDARTGAARPAGKLEFRKGALAWFSPDATRAVAVVGGTPKAWDVPTGTELASLTLPKAAGGIPRAVVFSSDNRLVALVGADGGVRVWDAVAWREVKVLGGRAEQIERVWFVASDRRLVAQTTEPALRCWDTKSWEDVKLQPPQSEATRARALAVSPDGTRVLLPGQGQGDMARQAVNVYDLTTGEFVANCLYTGVVISAAFSPDGKRLVTTGKDKTVRLWNAQNGGELFVLRGHSLPATRAAFSADGSRIVTSGADKLVKVWDARLGPEYAVFEEDPPTELFDQRCFSRDGKRSVHISPAGAALVLDAGADRPKHTIRDPDGKITAAGYNPDGSLLLTRVDRTIRLWNADTGANVFTFRHPGTEPLWGAAFAPDGKTFMTVAGGTVRQWGVGPPVGKVEIVAAEADPNNVEWAWFTADGSQLVMRSVRNGRPAVRVIDTRTRSEVVLKGNPSADARVVMSADGKWLMSFGRQVSSDVPQRGLFLWNTRTGEQTRLGGTAMILGAALSPDGKHLVASGQDGTGRVWNTETGKEEHTLVGHTNQILSVAYTPDGSRVVTGGADGTLRFWDPATGEELLALRWESLGLDRVEFSPDGRRLLTYEEARIGHGFMPWVPKSYRLLDVSPRPIPAGKEVPGK